MKNIENLVFKIPFCIRNVLLSEAKRVGRERNFYASCRYERTHKIKKHNSNNYFAARPNPGAGVGHQIANWTAGYWYAKVFGLKFAHIPFCSSHTPNDKNQWEDYLNLGEGEVTVYDLKKNGYRIVRLPLFDGDNSNDVSYIQNIIDSYGYKKIVFLAEQDQFYQRQYDIIPELQRKFFSIHVKEEAFRFEEDNFNIALHIRRGDIVTKAGDVNPNLAMRYQNNDYFVQALNNALQILSRSHKNIHIYLFSQGKDDDFPEFKKYNNLHFCLDMGAKDSFTHMVFADALITSKSSFSYKPALINQGIKFCPLNFWHGYPNDENWILLDDNGNFIRRSMNGTIENQKG